MTKKEIISLAILVLVLLFAVIRYQTRFFTETRTRIMMGTMVELSFSSPRRNLPSIVNDTFDLISRYEKKFSFYDTTGTLAEINRSNGEQAAIDEEFYELLTIAEEFYRKTGGKYDVTISPLTELWHQGRTTLPPPDSILAAKKLVGFDKLSYTEEYLLMPAGMKLNLGSIAKGYIIDKAIEYALAEGVVSGHINAGGDIRLFGSSGKRRIGIRHPRSPNIIIATLLVSEKAVLTSGDYERYFEIDGKRYHHIINPLTGYPIENMFSVTIVAPTATLADALTTSVFLLEPEEAIDLIKSYPEAEGIIYYTDGDEILSLRTAGIRQMILKE